MTPGGSSSPRRRKPRRRDALLRMHLLPGHGRWRSAARMPQAVNPADDVQPRPPLSGMEKA